MSNNTVVKVIPELNIMALTSSVHSLVESPEARKDAMKGTQKDYSLFMQLRQDFRREELYGAETVYCMDFSEIFPYLHPHGDPEKGHVVTTREAFLSELAIDQTKNKIVLPPAALVELLEHIAYLRGQIVKQIPTVAKEIREFRLSDAVTKAKEALAETGEPGKTKQRLRELVREIFDNWPKMAAVVFPKSPEAGSLADTIARLEKLRTRLTPVTDLISQEELDIDHDAYHRSLDYLTANRALKAQQNHRDAVNFAWTYYANGQSFKTTDKGKIRKDTPYYFVLITRGWPFESGLGPLEWPLDPVRDEGNFARAGLVRDINYVAARTLLERTIPNLTKRVQLSISEAQKSALFARLVEITEKKLAEKKLENLDLESIEKVIVEECGASLLEYHAIRSYRDDITAHIRETCEVLKLCQIENPSRSVFPEDDVVVRAVSKLLDPSNKELKGDLDKAKDSVEQARKWLADQVSSLWKAGLAIYGEGEEQTCDKFNIVHKVGNHDVFEILSLPTEGKLGIIDVRKHAFCIECEQLPGRFNWFLRLSKYIIRRAYYADARVPQGIPRVTKLFSGIEIVSLTDEYWKYGELDDGLNILDDGDEMWKLACQHFSSLPRFIRISTELLDIWYSFLEPQLRMGRVGLISHIGIPDPIAYFVIRCNKSLIRHHPLAEEIGKFLQKQGFKTFEVEYV